MLTDSLIVVSPYAHRTFFRWSGRITAQMPHIHFLSLVFFCFLVWVAMAFSGGKTGYLYGEFGATATRLALHKRALRDNPGLYATTNRVNGQAFNILSRHSF